QETLHFKFAISINDKFNPARNMKEFQEYAISNPYYQVQNLNQFTNTLKYFVMHPLNRTVENRQFFELKKDGLIFSSLTESKDGSGWLIRIYNPNKISYSGN